MRFLPGGAARSMEEEALDDDWLIRRIASGDRDALATLYQRYGRVVLAQIILVVGEPALSEEILQDTMLAIWQGARAFRGKSAVLTWIIAIARRRARDRLRHRPAQPAADMTELSEWPAREPGPEQAAIERAEATAVAATITELSEGHREILGLVFGAGLSLADAAIVLEIPVGTVKSRLSAARVALSRLLAEKGYIR